MDGSVYVFQADSPSVNAVFDNNPNFLIQNDTDKQSDYCVIYFSSNNIYFPNTEEAFQKQIVEKDFYEWFGTRIQKASKHIFVRDLFKQWYLKGISKEVNNQEKLLDLLQKLTAGYKVITMGSSAGAYEAMLAGFKLNAEYVLAFDPQFELDSRVRKSGEERNPLLHRMKDSQWKDYYDVNNFWNDKIDVFYFFSMKSDWDIEESNHIGEKPNLHRIAFSTSHHGIPFPKVALKNVINLNKEQLLELSKKKHSPFFFSVKQAGFWNTLNGTFKQVVKKLKRKF